MDWKDFIKTTEALTVLGGLLLTVLFGTLFAWLTAIAYVLLNVRKFADWAKTQLLKLGIKI